MQTQTLRARPASEAGFTLLEVMVVVVIIGMLATIVMINVLPSQDRAMQEKARADVSVLLNITPDHLDRYEYKFENYVASKFRIVQNQRPTDHFVYCADDQVIADYMRAYPVVPEQVPFSIKRPRR